MSVKLGDWRLFPETHDCMSKGQNLIGVAPVLPTTHLWLLNGSLLTLPMLTYSNTVSARSFSGLKLIALLFTY